jgi:hypothetical protein
LGSRGADLLYKAWIDLSKAVTPTTTLARELLQDEAVRRSVSPALAAAIELRAATTCDEVARSLAKVTLYGDGRSLRILKRAQAELGCETLGAQLEAAIAAVRSRPEPVF